MQKRQLIIIVVVVVVLGGSFGLNQFFASQKEAPVQRKVPVAKKYVKTTPVDYDNIQTYINAFGRVQTAQSMDLVPEASGRMFEGNVRLKEGQSFKKGTLLFYLDDKEATLTLKSQKSNFLKDLASILPDLKVDYDGSFQKWSTYFSKIDINKTLPEIPKVSDDKEKTFIATKGIYSSYYNIKSAEERLRKYRFYAPFDGSVINVNVESGAFVNPGSTIATIIRTGAHELKVSVETRDISWVQLGSPATLTSNETQQFWSGEVIRISDVIDQNTQSVNVFIKINPGSKKIYDGQFIEASVPARKVENGMIIPHGALYNSNEVFVVEDTLLVVKEVFVHRKMKESVIISGLEPGENLVIEPLVNAHNNMVVYKMEQKDIDMESAPSEDGETELLSN
ncbi:MAG: efflux RND transporter periplasmic adaptor subunit [Cyclobacteriaceae bacterium]